MDVVFVTLELDEFLLRRLFYQAVSEVEVTPVVSEGLPGAVTTANPTQVVWRAVVWIVNERRWQCSVPPQEELCRMPYVLCFGRYHVVSHDVSVNPALTLQMAQRVVNAPPRTRQPVRKETLLLGGVFLRQDASCTPAASLHKSEWGDTTALYLRRGGAGGGAFRQASRTQRWEDHNANVIGYS